MNCSISKCCTGIFIAFGLLAARASAQTKVSPTQSTSAQTSIDSLHVHVNLVNVPVSVIDASGASVAALRKQDFLLTENGRPETIRLFESASPRPLSIVLALDTSVSVRKDLPLEKQAAHVFIHSLLRPRASLHLPASLHLNDRLELLAFSGEVTEWVPFTDDLRSIDRGLKRLHGDGPTALYSAIVRGAQSLQTLPGRKVIVVISDGANSVAGADYQQAREAALRAQASITSIVLVPIAADAGRDLGGEHALIQLSRDTGGEYLYVPALAKLPDALSQVSASLQSEYLLGYYPASAQDGANSNQNGFRQIRVRMANPALNQEYRLHYRVGYYVNTGQ